MEYIVIHRLRNDGGLAQLTPFQQQVLDASYPKGRPYVPEYKVGATLDITAYEVKELRKEVLDDLGSPYNQALREELAAIDNRTKRTAVLQKMYIEAVTDMPFAQFMQEHYVDQGMSLVELEKKTGVSRSLFFKVMKGFEMPRHRHTRGATWQQRKERAEKRREQMHQKNEQPVGSGAANKVWGLLCDLGMVDINEIRQMPTAAVTANLHILEGTLSPGEMEQVAAF